jgi:hypothetical protein
MNKVKSIHNEDMSLTSDGSNIKYQIEEALKPIFKQWCHPKDNGCKHIDLKEYISAVEEGNVCSKCKKYYIDTLQTYEKSGVLSALGQNKLANLLASIDKTGEVCSPNEIFALITNQASMMAARKILDMRGWLK